MNVLAAVLLVLGVAVATVAADFKAALTIVKESGSIQLTTDKETVTFALSPPKKLPGKTRVDNPNVFLGRRGNDLIVVRFKAVKDGSFEFDKDGAAHINGQRLGITPASEIVLKDGIFTVDVIVSSAKPQTAQDDEILITDESLRLKRTVFNRVRRSTRTEVYLELGVIVDKGLWDEYVTNYGSLAEAQLDDYIGAVIDMLQSDYMQFTPKVHIEVKKYLIWKTQPAYTTASKYNGEINTYLENTALSPYNANALGVDHVTIISGYKLLKSGGSIGGVAFTDVICSPTHSVSVLNGGEFTAGYILAHELGHSFGILHDGDTAGQFEKNCAGVGFLMAPSTDKQGPSWSTCSKQRMQSTIDLLDSTNTNCLLNLVNPGTIDTNLGQTYPMESQCIAMVGACGRAASPVQDKPTDCRTMRCQSYIPLLTSSKTITKLDGTFCATGKTCQAGECLATSLELKVVNGGWGAWSERTDQQCGGNGCSKACVMVGQKQLQVQHRRCDSPFPNNGGAPCAGNNQRAVVCGATCTTGVSNRATADYNKCVQDYTGVTAATQYGSAYECLLVCSTSSGQQYTNAENGVPCSGGKGVCLNGQCAMVQCTGGSVAAYAFSQADCTPAPVFFGATTTTTAVPGPAGPPKDCVYQWLAWSTCSVTCGTGLTSRSRSPLQQATNGGVVCETSPSQQFATCKMAACAGQSAATYKFMGIRVNMNELTAKDYGTSTLQTAANWNACATACINTGQCKALLWDAYSTSGKCVVFTVFNQDKGIQTSNTSSFVLYLL